MHTKEKVTVLFAALTLVLPIVALVPQASASSPLGTIQLTKDCSSFTPTNPICTVVGVTSGPIPAGTVAYYTVLVYTNHRFNAEVLLTTPDGSTATGHVSLSTVTGLGTVTFTAGTEDLTGFHANIAVNCGAGCASLTYWDGTYFFTNS
jgi:hypothetical protein